MRLVEHIGGIKARRAPRARIDQFVEDEEQAERIDRSGVEVVVAIFGIVEVEAGQPAGADEPGDDLLDVDVGRMVSEVDQAMGLGPQRLRRHEAGSPV